MTTLSHRRSDARRLETMEDRRVGTVPPPTPPLPIEYGAGATGAALPVPGGAVTVGPGSLETAINANPDGTDFELLGGTYVGTFSNKPGNRYFGDPSDHTAVVFDGQATYPNLDIGTTANGGAAFAFTFTTDNTLANVTLRKYIGTKQGDAAYNLASSSGVLVQNVLAEHNQYAGLEAGGTNNRARYCTSRYNGQYGFHGTPSGNIIEWCDVYACGDNNMIDQGMTPRYGLGDRGCSKLIRTFGITVRNCHFHDEDNAHGWWFDGIRYDAIVEDCLFENITKAGVFYELGHTGTIRRNTFIDCGTVQGATQDYIYASIYNNMCGVIIIDDNHVISTNGGVKNGIMVYQGDRSSVPVDKWDPVCGTQVINNTVEGQYTRSWIGLKASVPTEGCDPANNPEQLIYSNNTELGSNIAYYMNGIVTPAEWAARGYS